MIDLLQYALVLDSERNFARAARKLGISQPTLTRGIQELERQFAVKLFDRTRRGAFPTCAGEILLDRARRISSSVDDLKREIVLFQGLQHAELKLGLGPVVAQTWVPDAIASLLAAHPEIDIHIKTYDFWELVPELLNKTIELAIGEIIPDITKQTEISVTQLPARPIRFFCRSTHPLARLKNPSIADIGQYPMASQHLPLRSSEHFSGTRALGKLSADGTHYDPQVSCQSFDVCLRIIKASDNIGIAPLSQLTRIPDDAGITIISLDAPGLTTNYGIMRLNERTLTPSATAFMERCVAAEKQYHSGQQNLEQKKTRPRKVVTGSAV